MAYNIEDLREVMREEGSFHFSKNIHLAEVVAPLPNIIIKFNELIFKKDQIKISQSRYFFDVHVTKTNKINCGGEHASSHEHIIIKDDLKLRKGDFVLIYITDNADMIVVIDKVVSI